MNTEKNLSNSEPRGELTAEEHKFMDAEIYEFLYPKLYSKIKDKDDKLEEITKIYFIEKINTIAPKQIKTFNTLYLTIDDLDNIELRTQYSKNHEKIKTVLEQKKEEIQEEAKKTLINSYMKKLYVLSGKKDKQKFYEIKTAIEENIAQVYKKGIDLTDTYKRLDEMQNAILKPKREIQPNKNATTFIKTVNQAKHYLNQNEYKKGIHLMHLAGNHLKDSDPEQFSKFKTQKNKIIHTYASMHYLRAFQFAERGYELMMNEHLDVAEDMMTRGNLPKENHIQIIKNTCYKELIHWSMSEIKNQVNTNPHDKEYINIFIECLEKNREKLEKSAQGFDDLQYSLNYEKKLNNFLKENNYQTKKI